jgi:hypothetical protein
MNAKQNQAATIDRRRLAALLGVSEWSLIELDKRGAGPVEPLRVGRSVRYRTSDVCALLGLAELPSSPETPP